MITHMPAAIKKTAMYLVVLSAAVIAMIYPTHDVETSRHIQDKQMLANDSKWQTDQDKGTSQFETISKVSHQDYLKN